MDQEHADYADGDLPPPINWMSQVVWPLLIVLGVVGASFGGCCLLSLRLGPAN